MTHAWKSSPVASSADSILDEKVTAINPDVDLGFAGIRVYQDQMAVTADALAVAKVAVYPMDPAGLQTQSMFQASARMRGNPVTGQHSIGRQIQREDQSRFNRQASMETLAEQTGGIVCINNNDLGDRVRKAVNDGSSFYEIAYYPDSSDWHGISQDHREQHKIWNTLGVSAGLLCASGRRNRSKGRASGSRLPGSADLYLCADRRKGLLN